MNAEKTVLDSYELKVFTCLANRHRNGHTEYDNFFQETVASWEEGLATAVSLIDRHTADHARRETAPCVPEVELRRLS